MFFNSDLPVRKHLNHLPHWQQDKSGSFWHKRYWDRLVRSEEHFWKIRRYILRNPEKAKLDEGQFLIYAPWHD